MTPEQEDRLIEALELLTAAIGSIAQTMELTYFKMYPARPPARDIDITHPLTAEERLRRDQGATGEKTTAEWTTLHDDETDENPEDGPYIRDWKQEERQRKATAAAKPARSRPDGSSAPGGRPPEDDA